MSVSSSSWFVNAPKSLTISEIAADIAQSRISLVIGALVEAYMQEGRRDLGLVDGAKHLFPRFTAEVVLDAVGQVTYGALRWSGFDLGKIGFVPVANITRLFAPRYIFAQFVIAALRTVSPRYLIALNVVVFVAPFFFPQPKAEKISQEFQDKIDAVCKIKEHDGLIDAVKEIITQNRCSTVELIALEKALMSITVEAGGVQERLQHELDYYIAFSKLPEMRAQELRVKIDSAVELTQALQDEVESKGDSFDFVTQIPDFCVELETILNPVSLTADEFKLAQTALADKFQLVETALERNRLGSLRQVIDQGFGAIIQLKQVKESFLPQIISNMFVLNYGNRFSNQQWIIGNVAAAALSFLAGVKLVVNPV